MLSKLCTRLLPLVFVLAFSFIALPAHAASVQQPSGHYTHQIDWAHPFRIHLPGPGMARSGIGPEQTGGLKPNISITPFGNFPTNCYNNYAYNVIVNGQTVWTNPYGNFEAWVEYQWCPTYSGDTVGINWAYGRDYVNSGCATVEVGQNYGPNGYALNGADLASQTAIYDDGEYTTDYNICSGYAWDYSQTAIGSGLYCAIMHEYVPSSGVYITAQSPCYH